MGTDIQNGGNTRRVTQPHGLAHFANFTPKQFLIVCRKSQCQRPLSTEESYKN